MTQSRYEQVFAKLWGDHADLQTPDVLGPVPEYQFHPHRKWRFDFAFPLQLVAVELQGGTFSRGRHVRGAALTGEYDKLNAAAVLGWRVLQFGPEHFRNRNKDGWVPANIIAVVCAAIDGGEAV